MQETHSDRNVLSFCSIQVKDKERTRSLHCNGMRAAQPRNMHRTTCRWTVILASLRQFWLILPETTAIGIRLSHASREGSALGRPLSNTWRTCPKAGDNLGKLRIIPHSPPMLECLVDESSGTLGWLCDLSGRREGNGLPSLRRVRALRDVARR